MKKALALCDAFFRQGDVEIHHPNIIHGSQANTSDRRRCGLTIRYIPTSTRVTVPPDHPIVPMNWLLHGKGMVGPVYIGSLSSNRAVRTYFKVNYLD